jgi:predicted nucleic-acid-binding protein
MTLIDANAIQRYTLNDNADMAAKVHELLMKKKVSTRYEVLAEVVYVLNKVYSLSRHEIVKGLKLFLSHPNAEAESAEVLTLALDTYAGANIDFIDSILYGMNAVYGYNVFSFDKKLNSMINKLS